MTYTLGHKTQHSCSAAWWRFIPIYTLSVAGAYFLAASVFQDSVVKKQILWFTINHEVSFNRLLFTHILVGVLFVALLHCFSSFTRVSISTGNVILIPLLICNILCFAIGINTPLLHTTKFWFIKEQHSFIQVLSTLRLKGEMQLYYIMLFFTFVIPVVKFLAMSYHIFISKTVGRKNIVLSLLSKWGMLDVMVVGVIVSTMKSGGGFAEINAGTGLTYFIASILLSMIITSVLPYTKNS